MDDRDQALAGLQNAHDAHSNFLTTLSVDPVDDAMRGDARFQALGHRVGLGGR